MSRQRKRHFRFATFVILPAILALTALVPAFLLTEDEASALSPDQWNKVKGYINSYFAGQYDPGNQGEAGFTIDRDMLKGRIDSNNNGTYLGEGDDAAQAPVLVDNLISQTTLIPGTSIRCNWNGGYGTNNCFDQAKVNDIKTRVDAHQVAGFSTDIAAYCLTGRTESPTAGGLGFLAQVPGALATDASLKPKVYAFKWGRQGWEGKTTTTSSTTGATGPGVTSDTGSNATNTPVCNGAATDAELVRCTAQWAIYSGAGSPDWGGNGYNITNGATSITSANRVIDLRSPSPDTTITPAGGPTTLKIPVNQMFNTGLSYIETRTSATKNIFAGRTQHVPGMAATGAAMLGYQSVFYVWGVNSWNTSLGGESFTGASPAYPFISVAANDQWSGIDRTAPAITSGPAVSGITANSASISRTANEPATMKVEYGTSPGSYTNTVNNTVLNADKTVQLTGLTENTRYYYKVTSFDGQANGTESAEQSFWTDLTPPSVNYVGPTGSIAVNNPTIEATASDNASGLTMASLELKRDGNALPSSSCTISEGNISCPTNGLVDGDYTAEVSVTDGNSNVGKATGSFTVAAGPKLELSVMKNGYWESSAAAYQYNAAGDQYFGDLSVEYKLTNVGPGDALDTSVVRATIEPPEQKNNIAVTPGELPKDATPTTISGNGGFATFTLKYRIPVDRQTRQPLVSSFNTKIFAQWKDATGNMYENNVPILEKDFYSTWYNYGNATAGFFVFHPDAQFAPFNAWESSPGGWDLSRSKIATGDFNGDGMQDQAVLYDYGNANMGLWIYEYESAAPVRKWLSGPGGWELYRSKVTAADLNGDGRDEVTVLYNYDNGNVGLFSFDSSTGYTPARKWLSGPGNWEWSRTQLASGDADGDGNTNVVVLYDYGDATTGLFVSVYPCVPGPGEACAAVIEPPLQRKWLSGPGGWEWSRSKIMSGDLDNDGKNEAGVLYNYGNANTGLFRFEPSGSEYISDRVWLSGAGNWEWSRTKRANAADANGDGRTELGILYNYGNASTGLFIFGSGGSGLAPNRVWMGTPGSWEWSSSRTAVNP